MVQLFNQTLELEVLKRLCSQPSQEASVFLGTIDESLFYTDIARTTFNKIKMEASKSAKIPDWTAVITDIIIDENHREILSNFEIDSLKVYDKSAYNLAYKSLTEYKKARMLQRIAEDIQNALLKDSINVEEEFNKATTKISSIRVGVDIEDCFTRIGSNSNCNKLLKKLLKGDAQKYLPTGFKGWDDVNGGLPRGKLVIIAATSGGGKSLCINQLALNFAVNNVKSCIIPLEMNATDMLQRFVSNKTSLDMSTITKGNRENMEPFKKGYDEFMKFQKMLDESGTSIDMFHPKDDMTMEEVLMVLKPFEYNAVFLDYIGLLGGLEGERQWQKMADAIRYAKIWAETTGTTVVIAAQLNDDMIIRYSKGMKEHADCMWSWNSGKISETDGTTIIKVEPQKGRNQEQKIFYLKVNFRKMSMEDATEDEIALYESKQRKREEAPAKSYNEKKKGSGGVQVGGLDPSLYDDL